MQYRGLRIYFYVGKDPICFNNPVFVKFERHLSFVMFLMEKHILIHELHFLMFCLPALVQNSIESTTNFFKLESVDR